MRRKKIKIKDYEIDNPLDKFFFNRKTTERIDKYKITWQYSISWAIVIIFFIVIVARIGYLQIIKNDYYKTIAENNRIRWNVILAPRGIIKDSDGKVLARNIPSFEIGFIPAYLPSQQNELYELTTQIAKFININQKDILIEFQKYPKSDKRLHQLADKIDMDKALRFTEKNFDIFGIRIIKTVQREYVDGKVYANIIGYDGKINKKELKENPNYLLIDHIGKNGLEKIYEKYLHGQPGESRYETDSNGKIIQNLGTVLPIAGYDLTLNIDSSLQKKIFSEAENIMLKNETAQSIVVIVINPNTGAIKAMVNYPGYDNNLFIKGIDKDEYNKLLNSRSHPLINKAIAGLYPPGSIFKPLVACAALEEKVITENTTVDCQGHINIGKWIFPDWKAHGVTDIRKAIAESCDVYFYTVGGGWQNIKGLGIDQLKKYSKLFGLGNVLGIDLPGEKKGLVPDATWKFKQFGKKWYIGDTYHNAIGQGYLLVTPLQMVVMTGTIANGGVVYQPQLVKEIFNKTISKKIVIDPKILNNNFLAKKNIKIVQEGMRQTVTSGSGRLLNSLKVQTAGKTGTAQFGNNDQTHSWYISYAPYEKPELAMVVLIEGGGEGHKWAVPLTKAVYKWYFDEKRGTTTKTREDIDNDKVIDGNKRSKN